MPQFDFTSPGADASDAISRYLLQQAALERQAKLDAISQQQHERDDTRADKQLAVQTDANKIVREQAEDQRQFTRASNIQQNMLPGVVTPETEVLLKKYGLNSGVQHRQAQNTTPETNGETAGTYDLHDEAYTGGGAKYQEKRAEEDARSVAATAAQAAAKDKADADRTSREGIATDSASLRREIAAMAASGRQETQGLRNDLVRTQIDATKAKTTDAAEAKTRNRRAIVDQATATKRTLDQLLDDKGNLTPGTEKIFGTNRTPEALVTTPYVSAFVPYGQETANKYAALNTLKARQIVDLIAEMKSQSKTGATGFGQLSEKEGEILANAAMQLANSQDPKQAATQLGVIREKIQKIMAEPAAEVPSVVAAPAQGNSAPATSADKRARNQQLYGAY